MAIYVVFHAESELHPKISHLELQRRKYRKNYLYSATLRPSIIVGGLITSRGVVLVMVFVVLGVVLVVIEVVASHYCY